MQRNEHGSSSAKKCIVFGSGAAVPSKVGNRRHLMKKWLQVDDERCTNVGTVDALLQLFV